MEVLKTDWHILSGIYVYAIIVLLSHLLLIDSYLFLNLKTNDGI